jgi:ELWxxDGT repeat protein
MPVSQRRIPLATTFVLACSIAPLAAQSATRLEAADPTTANSFPRDFVGLGPFQYFLATTNGGQREVFRTAGTPASTVLAIPFAAAPAPDRMLAGSSLLYFTAVDTTSPTGRSLFASSGTAATTRALIPAPPGFDAVTVGDRLVAVDSLNILAREIITSDGTPAGSTTTSFGAASPSGVGLIGDGPRVVVGDDTAGNRRAFVFLTGAQPGVRSIECFVSDGTPAGTTSLAMAPATQQPSQIRAIVPFGPGQVLVVANEGATPRVLVVDQASATFNSVGSLPVPSAQGPIPASAFAGRVVLSTGAGLFAADPSGITQLTFAGAPVPATVRLFGNLAGSLWGAVPDANGNRLIRLDPGSDAFVDVAALPAGSFESYAQVLGATFVTPFVAADSPGLARATLLRIDVATGQTTALASIPTLATRQGADSAVVNGRVLFPGFDERGVEPWTTDGTPGGTAILADLRTEPDFGTTIRSPSFTAFGSRTAFVGSPVGSRALGASTGGVFTAWTTDGTPTETTPVATDLYSSGVDGGVAEARNQLWARFGLSLFAIDPATGTATRANLSASLDPVAFGSDVLTADAGSFQAVSLARPDGSTVTLGPGTTSFGRILGSFGGSAYFWTNGNLYRTDGTPGGTVSIGTSIQRPVTVTPFDGRLWLAEGSGPDRLFSTDGSTVSQLQMFELPVELVVVEDSLVGIDNDELVVTDGTTITSTPIPVLLNNTVPVAVLGDQILFRVGLTDDLWAATLTGMTFTFQPLIVGQRTRAMVPVSRELAYVVVGDPPFTSVDLWRTDGTPLGTTLVQSFADIRDVVASNGVLYFNADDGTGNGFQPFVLRPEVFNLPVGQSCSGHPTGTHTLRTDVDPRVGRNVQLIGRSRFAGNGTGQVAGIFLGTASDVVTPLAVTRCEFRLDFSRPIAAITLPVDPAGNFQVGIQIPNLPVLAGLELTLQAAVAPSPSANGLDLTNGLHWTIGG